MKVTLKTDARDRANLALIRESAPTATDADLLRTALEIAARLLRSRSVPPVS